MVVSSVLEFLARHMRFLVADIQVLVTVVLILNILLAARSIHFQGIDVEMIADRQFLSRVTVVEILTRRRAVLAHIVAEIDRLAHIEAARRLLEL